MDTNDLAQQMAAGLRKLAEFIEQNPDLATTLRYGVTNLSAYAQSAEEMGKFARAAARAGSKVTKDWPDDPNRHVATIAAFGPVEVRMHTMRDVVCERVVTGTETVTKQVPDPEKLAAVPSVEVTETVEQVEWRCRPLLVDAPAVPR